MSALERQQCSIDFAYEGPPRAEWIKIICRQRRLLVSRS
jgi:hypothetical protein